MLADPRSNLCRPCSPCPKPDPHSPGVEEQIVYVAMLADGSQRIYTAAEFAKKFGWKNDPEKAELLGK